MTNTKQDAERQLDDIALGLINDPDFSRKQIEVDSKPYRAIIRALRQARASQEPRPQVDGTMYWNGVGTRTSCEEPRPAGGELRERARMYLRQQYNPVESERIVMPFEQMVRDLAAFSASERGPAGNGYTLCKEDGIKMYIGVTDFMLGWTAKPEEALYLSRRADADKLAEICDDAWTVESLPLPAPPAEKGEGR